MAIDISKLKGKTQTELLAIIAAMAAQPERKLSLKVSAKGALSVYGMGRWPVTLYKGQWERLLAAGDDIKAFIATNDKLLASKDDNAAD